MARHFRHDCDINPGIQEITHQGPPEIVRGEILYTRTIRSALKQIIDLLFSHAFA
jgi:hypothetical protein